MLHRTFTRITFQNKTFWLIEFSPSFGKDADGKVAIEQLTAEVDVIFMPHNNAEISY